MTDTTDMDRKIREAGVIALLQTEDPAEAVFAADALRTGGVTMTEIAFRNAAAYDKAAEAVAAVRAKCPQTTVGAATVSGPAVAEKALAAGAMFAFSAGFNPDTAAFCAARGLPFYPGVCTPGEIEKCAAAGLSVLKFFPAEACGGAAALRAFAGPYPQIRFVASGGVNAANAAQYFSCANTAAVSGSWLVPKDLLERRDGDGISRLAREAALLSLGFQFAHVGINCAGDADAASLASLLSEFGFSGSENPVSWFCGASFELMKNGGPGKRGHIGILTWSVERALAYLARRGISPVMESAKWCGERGKSAISFVYLDRDFGGFAVHLKRR